MIEQFTNRYPLDKTLRFSLIPIGETEKHFSEKDLLGKDDQRADDYKKVKGYIDEYFKVLIDDVLCGLRLGGVEEYAELYNKSNKTPEEQDKMAKKEADMRKAISGAFKRDKRYSSITNKDLITKELPSFLKNAEDIKVVGKFNGFTTYFTGFFKNRENMFSTEEKSTAISYRCINENLPKFIDNAKSFEKVREHLPAENIDELNESFSAIYGAKVEDIFALNSFSSVLPQSGITRYNEYIGGYSKDDGSKIQGLNEYINLYNQQIAKSDKSKRLPLMKPLFKQILSDRESASFIPEAFADDNKLLKAVNDFYCAKGNNAKATIDKLTELIKNIDAYSGEGIYLSSAYTNDISKLVFNDWSFIKEEWAAEYEREHKIGKNREKYYEKLEKEYESIKSFSICKLEQLGGKKGAVSSYFKDEIVRRKDEIEKSYAAASRLLTSSYTAEKSLLKTTKQ